MDPPGVEPGSTALSERRPRPVGLRSKRTVRESNPHSLATITGFEPDKHANATVRESGREDSNLRQLGSEPRTLTRLSYTQKSGARPSPTPIGVGRSREGAEGDDPSASTLATWRSTSVSYAPVCSPLRATKVAGVGIEPT